MEEHPELPAIDCVVRQHCFAAFFKGIEDQALLQEAFRTAQAQIASLSNRRSWPRDLELVLLVRGACAPGAASVRAVVDDRYVCRKHVLFANGRGAKAVLSELPFSTPDFEALGQLPPVSFDLQRSLDGFDPQLIADLATQRPGVDKISADILAGDYRMRSPSVAQSRRAPRKVAGEHCRLRSLDITSFRGIRRLEAGQMPLDADVVFIYGPNGVGKTSIAEALEWAITGVVNRLHRPASGQDPIVTAFPPSKDARVVCDLGIRGEVERVGTGQATKIRRLGTKTIREDRDLIAAVIGGGRGRGEQMERVEKLRELFRGSHLLSQGLLREFLVELTREKRFDILTSMVGAGEFVRFKEKLARVMGSLRLELLEVTRTHASLDEGLRSRSEALGERKDHLARLLGALGASGSPEEQALKVQEGLAGAGCEVDQSLVAKAARERPETRWALFAAHAHALVQSRLAEIAERRKRLERLESGSATCADNRARSRTLTGIVATANAALDKQRAEVRDGSAEQRRLEEAKRGLDAQHAEAAGHAASVRWMMENAPTHRQLRSGLMRADKGLPRQKKALQERGRELSKAREDLAAAQAQHRKSHEAVEARRERIRALGALQSSMQGVLVIQREIASIGEQVTGIDAKLEKAAQRSVAITAEVSAAKEQLTREEATRKAEAERHGRIQAALATLGEMVQTAQCPLCGRGFASRQQAFDSIREHLSTVPEGLTRAARKVEELRAHLTALEARAQQAAADMEALTAGRQDLVERGEDARQSVGKFRSSLVGMGVAPLSPEPAQWLSAIEQALSKEAEAEAVLLEAGLEARVKALSATVEELTRKVEEARGALRTIDTDRSSTLSQLETLEREITKRGFDATALPDDAGLAAQHEQACARIRRLDQERQKAGDHLRRVSKASDASRRRLAEAEADIEIRKKELRRLEAEVATFADECRALGVDPDDAPRSITRDDKIASRLAERLAVVDKESQALQQLAAAEGLRGQVTGLEAECAKLKDQVRAAEEKQKNQQAWKERLSDLEHKVGESQLDAVATHLGALEPTTELIYRRLNPHPLFGNIRITADEATQGLEILADSAPSEDQHSPVTVQPKYFFSDAQLNVLAITVFLAGALRQRWSGFDTVVIDDPIQQMDEMNVCAFLDLIRGLSSLRQFIIFTCSRDFYRLALEKLRCLNESKPRTFLAYRLEGIAPAELKVRCDAQ